MLRFVGAFQLLNLTQEQPIRIQLVSTRSRSRSVCAAAAAKQAGKKSTKVSKKTGKDSKSTQKPVSKQANSSPKRTKHRKLNVWNIDLAESDYNQYDNKASSPVKQQKPNSWESNVTGFLIVDQEEILQDEEPVISPLWSTFASNNRGVWGGVGAVFCPETAEVQPVTSRSKLHDFRIVSIVDSEAENRTIKRETLWDVAEETSEELVSSSSGAESESEEDSYESSDPEDVEFRAEARSDASMEDLEIVKLTSSYPGMKGVMEKVSMTTEPGLVFFEDGTFSRGPTMLLKTTVCSPTSRFEIEQCLVRAGHKRVRFVHTISVDNVTDEVDVLQCSVYEEEWLGPVHAEGVRESKNINLEPLSHRQRLRPKRLVGNWKVFEVNASVADEEDEALVFMCKEFSHSRSFPAEIDEEQGGMVWLPDQFYMYVELCESDVFRVGAGWLVDEGMSLAIERDYDPDGKLLTVRSKTEIRNGKNKLLNN